ncbi:MAG: hypothetical protein HQM08_24660 [Candidatus Riflebacteria bacterium]|nr:hypothetical protein [Candidatus Riflebacteria bacterium]
MDCRKKKLQDLEAEVCGFLEISNIDDFIDGGFFDGLTVVGFLEFLACHKAKGCLAADKNKTSWSESLVKGRRRR